MSRHINKVIKLYHCIMQALYEVSDPPVDWEALMASNKDVQEAFDFNEHYLPEREFELIVEGHLASIKLPKYWKQRVKTLVYLGPSPTSKKNKTG